MDSFLFSNLDFISDQRLAMEITLYDRSNVTKAESNDSICTFMELSMLVNKLRHAVA